MQVTISSHQIDVTDELKAHTQHKMEKLARHYYQLSHIQVILKVEKQRQSAEASLNTQGIQIYADATHEDMYTAIDMMIDKLDRQLSKLKEKTLDRVQGGR